MACSQLDEGRGRLFERSRASEQRRAAQLYGDRSQRMDQLLGVLVPRRRPAQRQEVPRERDGHRQRTDGQSCQGVGHRTLPVRRHSRHRTGAQNSQTRRQPLL